MLLLYHDPVVRQALIDACRDDDWRITTVSSISELSARMADASAASVIALSAACIAQHGTQCNDSFFGVLDALLRRAGHAQTILITDEQLDLEACCEAVRRGVNAFFSINDGDLDADGFRRRARAARRRYEQRMTELSEIDFARTLPCDSVVWRSAAMAGVLAQAARAAQVSDVPVLICGETGTGKQLIAELIHQMDPKRSAGRFISVNCSAISGQLAESTLFGHTRGAFTGAVESRLGHFRAADGGTILLDEIGEMDAALQPKLLRVLQNGVVMPVGADEELPIDVRVIAATNRRLSAQVDKGEFRLDLFQRLNVIALDIPPLRERPEDIPALVSHFVNKYTGYSSQPVEAADDELIEFFSRCGLRGNVRELENTIRRMLAFKRGGGPLTLADVPAGLRQHPSSDEGDPQRDRTDILAQLGETATRLLHSGTMTLPELIASCEKMVLRSALRESRTTSGQLARQLGMSRRTLYNKISKYDLPAPREIARQAS